MNIVATFFGLEIQLITLVQRLEVLVCYVAISEVIQNVYERFVLLSEHFRQFNRNILYALQCFRVEEIRRVVVSVQQFFLFGLHHGGKLLQVANHQELHSAKRLVVFAEATEHRIDGVENVGTHHTNLVDNEQVERSHYLSFLFAVFKARFHHTFGHERGKRKLKKRVNGYTTSIYGSHSRRCYHYHSLCAVLLNGTQKSCFSCTSLSCKKDTDACVFYKVPRVLQFCILFHRFVLAIVQQI